MTGHREKKHSGHASGPGISRYLVFTTFVAGAIIMVLELIGSRVIGPPFGVSLFVWTSLISVALVGLALGYWIGGKLADSIATPAALFNIILIAGAFTFTIPLTKGFIMEHALSLGLRGGSLVSSAALFGPPLFFLGMVAPYTVKLYMKDELERVGKTVGGLYAISTCGSFLGTIFTGFLLIPNLGVNNIIYLSSATLLTITALYWIIFRGKLYAMAAVTVPVALLFIPENLPSVTRPDGTEVRLLINKDSAYGQIKVVDYSYGDERLREFLLENMVQGGIEVNSGLSISKYTYYIEHLANAYKSDASRALVIGLGSGIIPGRFLAHYGITTDVVEINRDVVETAERYFSYDTGAHDTFIQDGRTFLKRDGSPYDIIVLDAFSGDTPPGHLISLEAFAMMSKRLSDDGVLLINFVGTNREEDSGVPASLYRTLGEVFPRVDIYAGPEYARKSFSVVNMIFAASMRATAPPTAPSIEAPVWPPFRDDIDGLLGRKVSFNNGPFLFTDDYNPVDFEDRRAREAFRYGTVSSADREIMIY